MVEEILPGPGQLKATLRLLNQLAGGHADATVNGHHEITVPSWLAEKYREATTPPAPKRRSRRSKNEVEEQ